MKLQYKHQDYQQDAVNAVCDVFNGQPFSKGMTRAVLSARRKGAGDGGASGNARLVQGELQFESGRILGRVFGNRDIVSKEEGGPDIKKNIASVQFRNELPPDVREGDPTLTLDVEMETGTGKTFVYTNTIHELHKRYGWAKFIIVVPSVAIREGVKKSLDSTTETFSAEYHEKIRSFVYDSSNLSEVKSFVEAGEGDGLRVMIINMQSFNSNKKDSKRLIAQPREDFNYFPPIKLIAKARPIIILDEPQKMGESTMNELQSFDPLFVLRYSATFAKGKSKGKKRGGVVYNNLVYRLDPIDAFKKKLVKKIEPICIDEQNVDSGGAFLYCEDVRTTPNGPEASVVINCMDVKGNVRPRTRVLKIRNGNGDDLVVTSGGLEAYRDFVVESINAKPGYEKVEFRNGVKLHLGESYGDRSEEMKRRLQIHEAILAHFRNERRLFGQGIKTLTLFFIDAVDKYPLYTKMFEEEFEEIRAAEIKRWTLFEPKLVEYWKKWKADEVRSGYFAVSKNKKLKEYAQGSKEKEDNSEEAKAAYELILKDKEGLLSLKKPVRFIFSHSALREGWDNPNVFVICLLKNPVANQTARRQEIGRGLRLCVNQEGERIDDPAICHRVNVLTLVSNEGYKSYVEGLQNELKDAAHAHETKADVEFLKKYAVRPNHADEGKERQLTDSEAETVHKWLKDNGYIDNNDEIKEKWHQDVLSGTLPTDELPEELQPYRKGIVNLIDHVLDPKSLKEITGERRRKEQIEPNDNFRSEEFMALWDKISGRSIYLVSFDSEEVISRSLAKINSELNIPSHILHVTRGTQGRDGMFNEASGDDTVFTPKAVETRYDLVGDIAELTTLTRQTVVTILKGLTKEKFAMFRINPTRFISEVARLINEAKGAPVIANISYEPTGKVFSKAIFTENQLIDAGKMMNEDGEPDIFTKHIYDYLDSDSKVERKFAKAMDLHDKIRVYAKLPRLYKIPTPFGEYNPDWAIVFNESEDIKHVYFIAETKGTMQSSKIRGVERNKIECAVRHFKSLSSGKVKYDVVHTIDDLMNLVLTDISNIVDNKDYGQPQAELDVE